LQAVAKLDRDQIGAQPPTQERRELPQTFAGFFPAREQRCGTRAPIERGAEHRGAV
jgi:hypothetical protein